MPEELKPCPFCGGRAEIQIESSYYLVSCANGCGTLWSVHEPEVIESWNRQPHADALRARVAELEAQWASVPWEAIRTTIVCARHWTPHQQDGLNFREDHRTFDSLTAWVDVHAAQG